MDYEKLNDFADFNKNNIIKVVVSDNEFLGFVSWNFSHTLNFFNTEFENTDVQSIGDFKKEANMDTYFVEYLLNGKEHLYTFKSDKSEEAVREYVEKYIKGNVPVGTNYNFWKKVAGQSIGNDNVDLEYGLREMDKWISDIIKEYNGDGINE